jgi:hypothetical protein
LAARGFIAGLAAISGAAPWISFSSALFLGAAAGLLLAPVTYVTERTLKLEDSGAAAGMLALPALLGLLAAGLVTTRTSPVQGQLQAQLVGMGALVVLAGVAPWIVLGILAQGYALGAQVAPRLPARVRRAEGQAEKRAPVEPPHPGLWQRARVRWARLRVPTGRRLRHRRRSAANPSEWSAPAEVSDSASDA